VNKTCLLLFVFLAAATDATAQLATMKKMPELRLGITIHDDYSKSIGLSDESAGNAVLVGIKRDLPRLKLVSGHGSQLLVSIICLDADGEIASCHVMVELIRPAFVLTDQSDDIVTRRNVAVWNKQRLMTGDRSQMASSVREYVGQVMTEFAAEYYKQNPN
jgi:hypothetical protein